MHYVNHDFTSILLAGQGVAECGDNLLAAADVGELGSAAIKPRSLPAYYPIIAPTSKRSAHTVGFLWAGRAGIFAVIPAQPSFRPPDCHIGAAVIPAA